MNIYYIRTTPTMFTNGIRHISYKCYMILFGQLANLPYPTCELVILRLSISAMIM